MQPTLYILVAICGWQSALLDPKTQCSKGSENLENKRKMISYKLCGGRGKAHKDCRKNFVWNFKKIKLVAAWENTYTSI